MPCRDYEPNISSTSHQAQINRQAEKLDQLTALLCKASQMLIKAQPTSSEAQDVFAWYEAHRDADIGNIRKMLNGLSIQDFDFFNKKVSIEDFDKLDAILCKILGVE
jgi:hypothetical protein